LFYNMADDYELVSAHSDSTSKLEGKSSEETSADKSSEKKEKKSEEKSLKEDESSEEVILADESSEKTSDRKSSKVDKLKLEYEKKSEIVDEKPVVEKPVVDVNGKSSSKVKKLKSQFEEKFDVKPTIIDVDEKSNRKSKIINDKSNRKSIIDEKSNRKSKIIDDKSNRKSIIDEKSKIIDKMSDSIIENSDPSKSISDEKSDSKSSTDEKSDDNSSTDEKSDNKSSTDEKSDNKSNTNKKSDNKASTDEKSDVDDKSSTDEKSDVELQVIDVKSDRTPIVDEKSDINSITDEKSNITSGKSQESEFEWLFSEVETELEIARDSIRTTFRSLHGHLWWRLLISTIVVGLQLLPGFISAYTAVTSNITVFPSNPKANAALIYVPLGLLDFIAVILILLFHDIPVCDNKPVNKPLYFLGMTAEVFSALGWTALTWYIIYDAFHALSCYSSFTSISSITSIAQANCQLSSASLQEAAVMALCWIKSIANCKGFVSRSYTYPVVCTEQLLFYNQIEREEPHEIVAAWSKFNNLKSEQDNKRVCECCSSITCCRPAFRCCQFLHSPHFEAIISFTILIVMDLAGMASVAKVFESDDISYTLRCTLPCLSIVVANIISNAIFYKYHDMKLCEHKEIVNMGAIRLATVLQVAVSLAWTGLLAYMIYEVSAHVECPYDKCTCFPVNGTTCQMNQIPDVLGLPSSCPVGFTCLERNSSKIAICAYGPSPCNFTNTVVTFTGAKLSYPFSACTIETIAQCLSAAPRGSNCVLLAIVVFFTWQSTIGIFYRVQVYTVTFPETIQFLYYWKYVSPKGSTKRKWIPLAVGRMEYGLKYKLPKGTEKKITSHLLSSEKKG